MSDDLRPDNTTRVLSARELARRAGSTVRTIHYYVAEGLLPPPEGISRSAVYTESHLARLKIIAALRTEGLSLAAIRGRIRSLSVDGALGVLETLDRYRESIDAGEVTALGLIEAAVTDETTEPIADHQLAEPALTHRALMSASKSDEAHETDSARDYIDRMLRRSAVPRPHPSPSAQPPSTSSRPEVWYHFEIEDGIELRIREDRIQPNRGRIPTLVDTLREAVRHHRLRPGR